MSLLPPVRTGFDAEDDPGGVFRFGPGKAAYYASEVRLALSGDDNYRKAATDAERAENIALFRAYPAARELPAPPS